MFLKKHLSVLLAFAFVLCGAFAFSSVTSSSISMNASAGTTAVGNITEMIEDLVPSFVLLIFIMAFMLLLLNMVDRVGKH